jgi:hypothetical protein
MGCVAVAIFVVSAQGNGPTELAVDCSADPWSHECHPASMMDMINSIGHRADSNAIAQHKLKMQLLAQQKVQVEKEEKKEETDEEKRNAKGTSHAPSYTPLCLRAHWADSCHTCTCGRALGYALEYRVVDVAAVTHFSWELWEQQARTRALILSCATVHLTRHTDAACARVKPTDAIAL